MLHQGRAAAASAATGGLRGPAAAAVRYALPCGSALPLCAHLRAERPDAMHLPRRRLNLIAVAALIALAGCGPVIDALNNAAPRTVTLRATRTAAVNRMAWTNFGVCHSRLEQRVTGSRVWGLFTRSENPDIAGVFGYEVRVSRGESCHYREWHTMQAAFEFDIASLPAGAITEATLTVDGNSSLGLDPDIEGGTTDQCNVSTLGRATAAWEASRDLRALIPYERVQPAPRPFGWGWRANRAFDVTRTVRAWREGAPNLGFVLSPEADAVSRNAATVGDVGDQFMCGVQVGGYELTVSMLVPRTAP